MGFQTTGVASHYFAVDAAKVTPLPEKMGFDEGAMIEPLAVAVHAVKRAGDVKGAKIAVLGAGPIGILVAQTAKGLGAESVMITDISDLRLKKAKECGVDFCVNTKNADFGDAMVENFGPDKMCIRDRKRSVTYFAFLPMIINLSVELWNRLTKWLSYGIRISD